MERLEIEKALAQMEEAERWINEDIKVKTNNNQKDYWSINKWFWLKNRKEIKEFLKQVWSKMDDKTYISFNQQKVAKLKAPDKDGFLMSGDANHWFWDKQWDQWEIAEKLLNNLFLNYEKIIIEKIIIEEVEPETHQGELGYEKSLHIAYYIEKEN